MTLPRSSGILLHPTSLPGPYGIGELGQEARAFLDWLAASGQHFWQVMPLGPTGYGDSPYQAFSAFAGNPYLIALDTLRDEGLLLESDFEATPEFDPRRVDYGLQYTWRHQMLRRAFTRFEERLEQPEHAALRAEFETFKAQEAEWLGDYALFMALKLEQGGLPWNAWPLPLRQREEAALSDARDRLRRETERVAFQQFMFARQWRSLRDYAAARGIQVIGDIPIFVALDSSDAWANPEQFFFDDQGQPTVVAGVPPDYFSETGQLWGNPLYNWEAMAQGGFKWWIKRFKASLKLYDLIRVDHFRGFAGYWEVPYPAENAMHGRWVTALGHQMFAAVREALGYSGPLPIIAEDLGVITPDVEALRDDYALPGMAVLQFAFGGGDYAVNAFLPHNLKENQVVYTGTHDNDTSHGWWLNAEEGERANFRAYTGLEPSYDTFTKALIEMAFASRANLAVVPLQDVLNLGSDHRMNLPGTTSQANWSWRYLPGELDTPTAVWLRELTERTGRKVPPAASSQ